MQRLKLVGVLAVPLLGLFVAFAGLAMADNSARSADHSVTQTFLDVGLSMVGFAIFGAGVCALGEVVGDE
ncbi:MAG: hypothetical protein ACRDD1_18160 [Planctomycetia bacterium]